MCGICIGGLCIPYGAILPMLLVGLQWIVQQLSNAGISLPKFITNRLTTDKSNSSEDHHQITQDDNNNNICNDFWCLCKKRFARKSSVEGDVSVAATDTSFSSLSDDDDDERSDGGEEIMIHSDQRQKGKNVNAYVRRRRRRRRNEMAKSTTKINFFEGDWCMPCQ